MEKVVSILTSQPRSCRENNLDYVGTNLKSRTVERKNVEIVDNFLHSTFLQR